MLIKCEGCGTEIEDRTKNNVPRKFCTPACRERARQKRYYEARKERGDFREAARRFRERRKREKESG
jgi:hypothetical protein